jgi:hypothetical protein
VFSSGGGGVRALLTSSGAYAATTRGPAGIAALTLPATPGFRRPGRQSSGLRTDAACALQREREVLLRCGLGAQSDPRGSPRAAVYGKCSACKFCVLCAVCCVLCVAVVPQELLWMRCIRRHTVGTSDS